MYLYKGQNGFVIAKHVWNNDYACSKVHNLGKSAIQVAPEAKTLYVDPVVAFQFYIMDLVFLVCMLVVMVSMLYVGLEVDHEVKMGCKRRGRI